MCRDIPRHVAKPYSKLEGALVCFFLILSLSLAFFNPCVLFRIEWLNKKSEMLRRDGREKPAPLDTRTIKAHNTASIDKWGCLVFLIALETICTPRWIEKEWTEWRLTPRAWISCSFAVMKIRDSYDEKDQVDWEYFLETDPKSRKFRNSKQNGLGNWKYTSKI